MNKQRIFILVMLFTLVAGYSMAASQKVVMEIEGMTCKLCTLAVKRSLSEVEGVADVKVSYQKKTARLTADDSVTDATLAEAVQASGYNGKVVERITVK